MAVFTRDTTESREALKALITAYTGNPVDSLTVKQNEPSVEGTNDRQIRFDISVKFNDGKLADIEMNLVPTGTSNALGFDIPRGEFYLGKLHSSQSIHGIEYDYSDLKETWQISFFNNRTFFNDDAIIHKFEYYDIDNKVSLAGITYARREGRQEERREIQDEAQNMLKQGMTAEQVLKRLLGK
jgi:hypothetical protein